MNTTTDQATVRLTPLDRATIKNPMTKAQALEAVDGLGAIQASEALCGILAMAISQGYPTSGIEAAIKTIDRQLETWAKLKTLASNLSKSATDTATP